MPAKQRWILSDPPDPGLVRAFSERFGLAEMVVALAVQRGFTDEEELERFFYPRLKDLGDPMGLPGMPAAVERILIAVDEGESVLLYGDYDVDGVSSIALLHRVLSAYGLEPRCFLPARLEEGYGLSVQGIERSFAGRQPDLLIAADCGTNSRAEADLLKKMEIDLIILDHHEPSSEGTAACVSLVNPKLGPDYHYLCTGGVVFKLAHALMKVRPLRDFDLKDSLDLVALATIADIVPLEEENRIFARRGLMQLDRTIHPGIEALKQVAGVRVPAQSNDVGFKLGPRLNAAGRLDTASTSLNLLLSEDRGEAEKLARELDLRNRERQELELETREEAEKMIQSLPPQERSHAIVVGARGWHPGVVGIVASRIARQYHRPTFVVAFDETGRGKGSGRSVDGISLVEALEAAGDVIEAGGGHEMAAGVTVREDRFEEFRRRVVEDTVRQADSQTLVPKLIIDAELKLSELTLELLDSYELLRPFGQANRQPVFMSRSVDVETPPRVIKDRHLKFRFRQEDERRDAICFNGADQELPRPPWDVAFTIDRNEYRGRSSVSIVVQAIRKAT